MNRILLYFLLILHTISIGFSIYGFIHDENLYSFSNSSIPIESKSIATNWQTVPVILCSVFELFWYGVLILVFNHSRYLIEPQAYLYTMIFVCFSIKDLLLGIYGVILENGCLFYDSFDENTGDQIILIQKKIIPYTIILTLSLIESTSFLVMLCFRLYLSFVADQVVVERKVKFITAFLITIISSTVFCIIVNFPDDTSLALTPFISASPYIIAFFMLIAYGSRNYSDERSYFTYFSLWCMFVLNLLHHIIDIDIYNTQCLYTNDVKDYYLDKQEHANWHITASSLIPLILLDIDKNVRRSFLSYFPKRQVHGIGERYEQQRHDARENEVRYNTDDTQQSHDAGKNSTLQSHNAGECDILQRHDVGENDTLQHHNAGECDIVKSDNTEEIKQQHHNAGEDDGP